jgi:signal transduction histidine kinase
MYGLYIYQLYEAERPKTAAEERAANIRRGETAAAISHQLRTITGVIRSLVAAALARDSGRISPPPAPARCPESAVCDALVTASASAGCPS